MDRRAAIVPYQVTLSVSREDDSTISLPTAIPFSGALMLGDLESKPAGQPSTPTANQMLNDDDLAIVAGVWLRF